MSDELRAMVAKAIGESQATDAKGRFDRLRDILGLLGAEADVVLGAAADAAIAAVRAHDAGEKGNG